MTMNGKEIEKKHHQTFGDLKQENDAGMEFWYASDLQTVLDYSTWDKFKRVIQKAITACDNSGQPAENHFSQVVKMVRIGSSAQREIEDFELSRYACYLIVQNGDPIKPVIANGQTYFAIQTRGYKGLYGGLDAQGIHKRKGLMKSQKILGFIARQPFVDGSYFTDGFQTRNAHLIASTAASTLIFPILIIMS
jgi:hypothetical protein